MHLIYNKPIAKNAVENAASIHSVGRMPAWEN